MDTNTTIETTPETTPVTPETTETIDLRRWSRRDSTTTPETTPETSAETTAPTGALLPKYALTPKRGASRVKREPEKLLAYVREHGAILPLDETVYAALEQRGLPKHRVVNAVSDLKKYYGIQITAARTGRKVTSYTFAL